LPALLNTSGVVDAFAKMKLASFGWITKGLFICFVVSFLLRLLFKDPGVSVFLVAGDLVPTDSKYEYDASAWIRGPVKTFTEPGDGTVALRSALVPHTLWKWSSVANVTLFPHADHVGILATAAFLEWVVATCAV
jgi:hypothetical protein